MPVARLDQQRSHTQRVPTTSVPPMPVRCRNEGICGSRISAVLFILVDKHQGASYGWVRCDDCWHGSQKKDKRTIALGSSFLQFTRNAN